MNDLFAAMTAQLTDEMVRAADRRIDQNETDLHNKGENDED